MKIVNVMASSVDGFIGSEEIEGDRRRLATGLSSCSDKSHLLRMMAGADAIIVGASSIRANGECLVCPDVVQQPAWYIFCQNALPPSLKFWAQKQISRTLVVQEAGDFADLPILEYGEAEPSLYLYHHLKARGYRRVLLFGGGKINSWFYENRLVDQLSLTIAPLIIAKKGAPHLIYPSLSNRTTLSLESFQVEENFVFLTYAVL